MAKKIWRPLNTWGLVLVGFCCVVALSAAVAII